MKAKYSTFTEQVQSALRLLRLHKITVTKLFLLPIVPFAFITPYLLDVYYYNLNNVAIVLRGSTLIFFIVAIVAAIAFLILCEMVKVALYATFASKQTIGARKALQIGAQRFPAFLYTEVLIAIFVFIALVPVLVLNYWFSVVGRELLNSVMPLAVTDLLILIVAIFFLIPAFIVGIWLSFAQIISAIDNKSGLTALTHSVTLIRPNFKPIALRMVGWTILTIIVSYMVSTMPLAHWLIPIILMLLGVAFVVVVYKETSDNSTANLSTKAGNYNTQKTRVRRKIIAS